MPENVSLSGIEFTIKGSTDSASASVDSLVEKLGQLKTALTKISSATAVVALERLHTALEKFNTGTIDTVVSAFNKLGHTFAYMDASADAISSLASLSSSISGLSKNSAGLDDAVSALTQIAEVDYQGLQDASEGLKGMASAARSMTTLSKEPEKVGEVVTWLSQLATIDFTNLSEAAESIKTISNSAKSISSASKATSSTASSVKSVGEAAKRANNPLSNFVSSLKRIAFYRIIRSVIKSITESFSEGLTNAYEYSKTTSAAISDLYENASEAMADLGNSSLSLSQSLDLIKTVSQTMKNQLGAAFGSLIQSLTPIITYLIRLVTSLASAITRLIAILSGKSTYLQAVDNWTQWGEAASDAGSSAKEALKYLAPFDELNRLPDASSSGGGSGSDTNYGDMFQEVSTDVGSGFLDTLTEAFQNIANWFEGYDWQGLGESLWDSVKSIFTDGTKANECVRSFFEALGSAFGAVAGTVWGFVSNAVDDLMNTFMSNIKDYNGDNKITVIDIITAILKTGGDMLHWVDENIVAPFVNGFIRALTDNDDFDFSTWVETNIVTPVKSGWNSIVDWINTNFNLNLPKIPIEGEITDIGISDNVNLDDGLTDTGVSDGIFNGVGLGVSAVIERIKDNVASQDKTLGECIADLVFAWDDIPDKWKQLKDFVAAVFDFSDDVPEDEKKIPITGNMNAADDNIPKRDKTIIGTLKYGNADKTGLSDAAKTVFKGVLRYNSADKTFLKDIDKTVTKGKLTYASADKTKLTDNYKTVTNGKLTYASADKSKLTDGMKTVTQGVLTYANVDKSKLTQNDRTVFKGTLTYADAVDKLTTKQKTIDTISKFTTWSNWLGTPEINSKASLSSYKVASSINDGLGNMIVSGILNIVGQKGYTQFTGGDIAGPAFKAASATIEYSLDGEPENENVIYRAVLRALGEADLSVDGTLDGDVVYRAVVNRNKAMKRAYGVNPMLTT